MPITFKVAKHDANPVRSRSYGNQAETLSAEKVLKEVWKPADTSCKEVLQSSFDPKSKFTSDKNGFVNTVLWAYNEHHNLVIRPDDLWISILSQFNLFVNAHGEELRTKFVSHEGKKELRVETVGSRYTVDFGKLANTFGSLLKQNIVDPSLHEWILPSYTTTTPNDTVICSVMMMSTLKTYFDFTIGIMCGLPSVTLLGEKHDYENILQRVDKLSEFGEEPDTFARLLRPILAQFVDAFDVVSQGRTPDSEFWGKICHMHSGGSGPTYISGWLSAFSSWDKEGKWQGPKLNKITEPLSDAEKNPGLFSPPPPLIYEGLRYPVVDTDKVPPGFCEVDVKVDDNGQELACVMVAGHVGSITSGKGALDTLQPASEWFMFVKGDVPQNPYD